MSSLKIFHLSFQGLVYFKESEEFKVLLNITAPTIEEAYAVHSEMMEDKGRLVIQVVCLLFWHEELCFWILLQCTEYLLSELLVKYGHAWEEIL